MAQETIFSKIIRKEIPADIPLSRRSGDRVSDIQPKAKDPYSDHSQRAHPHRHDVELDHELALGRMFTVARKLTATRASPRTATASS